MTQQLILHNEQFYWINNFKVLIEKNHYNGEIIDFH